MHELRKRAAWALLPSLCACSSHPSTEKPAPFQPGVSQPSGWDSDIALPLAEDHDDDPNVIEIDLEAREQALEIVEGRQTTAYTYNGTIPGPLIRGKVGDRLIVHFKNLLPESTTIHWHGVRVPANMDGSEMMQSPVEPGASFDYEFVLTDPGTYWYHPHVRSTDQVGYGLYGALVVEDESEPVIADDVVLVFSDMSLTQDGSLMPGDQSDWFGDYFGREGDVLLVNGKIVPTLQGRAGAPQRWRIVNAARARYLRLHVPGISIVRVGGDAGLLREPLPIEELVLAPSERAELWVNPPEPGLGEITVFWEDTDRFNIGEVRDPVPLLTFDVVEDDAVLAPELPALLRTIDPIDTSAANVRMIELGEKAAPGGAVLTINGKTLEESEPHMAKVGDTEIWEVTNATPYNHPFHLHGFSFQVLDVDGKPWPVLENKDTVDVRAEQTVRFAVHYDDRPGHWMFHCHILDHAKLGMMATLHVEP